MPTTPSRISEIDRALTIKRTNAITAAITGGGLAAAVVHWYGFGLVVPGSLAVALGAACGVLYANSFEYVLHRFFLHWGNGFLVQRHALHHNSAGADNEARYINFASSPLVVVLVFALNAPPVLLIAYCLHLLNYLNAGAFGAGMFAGFTLYFVVYEAVHWRIHMGGWLPGWMRFARHHHMLHHRDAEGHYSVFLPIFDWVFTHSENKRSAPSG